MPEQVPYTGDGVTASKTGWPIVRSVEAPHITLHTGRGARPKEKQASSETAYGGLLGEGMAGLLNPNPLCSKEEYMLFFNKENTGGMVSFFPWRWR